MSLIDTREGYIQHQLSTIWSDALAQQYHEDIVSIARAAHTANLLFSQMNKDNVQVFDPLEWEQRTEEDRASGVSSVINMIKFPVLSGREAHDIWMEEKLAAGWKYGDIKDADKKEHPCIVPYNDLNLYDKFKDDLYISVINALIRQLAVKVLTIYKTQLSSKPF